MHTWTEQPQQAMWQQLRYLSHAVNVEHLLIGAIDSQRKPDSRWADVAKGASEEIAAYIRQADEYFKASRAISIEAKPLPLYYGILCLSKAVILANDPEVGGDQIQYHGLQSKDKTSSRSEWFLTQEFFMTNGGVFPKLCEAVEGVKVPRSQELKLEQIITRLPDLHHVVSRLYQYSSNCFLIYSPRGEELRSCF